MWRKAKNPLSALLSVIICTCFIDEKEQANVSSFSLHVLIIGNDRHVNMVRGKQMLIISLSSLAVSSLTKRKIKWYMHQ